MRRAPHALAIAALVAAWVACAAATAFNPYADGSISSTPSINSSSTANTLTIAPGSVGIFAFNASTMTSTMRAGTFQPDAGHVIAATFTLTYTVPQSFYYPTINVYWVKDATYDESNNLISPGTDVLIYHYAVQYSTPVVIPIDIPYRYASARGAPNNGVFVLKINTLTSNSMLVVNTKESGTPCQATLTADTTTYSAAGYSTCEACLGVNVATTRSPAIPFTMAWCATTGKCLDAMKEVGASYAGSCPMANISFDSCPSGNGLPPTFNTFYAQTTYAYNYSNDGLPILDINSDLSAASILVAAKATQSMDVFSNIYFYIDTSTGFYPNASTTRLAVHGLEVYSQPSQFYALTLFKDATQFSKTMTWNNLPKPDAGQFVVNWRYEYGQGGTYKYDFNYFDLAPFAKYTNNPQLLLQLNFTSTYNTPQFFFHSDNAALQCLRPRLFVASSSPGGYYDPRPTQTQLTCSDCLSKCANLLNACGWCNSNSLCIDGGVLPPANCQAADWYTTTCPAVQGSKTFINAISDYSLFSVDTGTDQYYLPLWDENSNRDEKSILYFRINLANVENRVSSAKVSVSRGLWTVTPTGAKHGFFWLDIPDNTTLQQLSFYTKQQSPKYLIQGVATYQILDPLTSYTADVTSIVKKAVARGQQVLWFALDSASAVENWIDDSDMLFPLAHPRVAILYGDPANYSEYDSLCSKCFTQCPSLTLNCGYCFDTQRCMEGDERGPFNQLECAVGWSFRSCPIGASNDTLATAPISDAVHVASAYADTNFAASTFLYLGYESGDLSAIYLRFNASTFRNMEIAKASLYLYTYVSSWGHSGAGSTAPSGTIYSMSDPLSWNPAAVTWNAPPLYKKQFSGNFMGYVNMGYAVFESAIFQASSQINVFTVDMMPSIVRALGDPRSQDMVSVALTPNNFANSQDELFNSLNQNSMPQFKPQIVLTLKPPVPQCVAQTCADCLLMTDCGWCDSTSTCMLGGPGGPMQTCRAGALAWFFNTCPLNYFTAQPYMHRTFITPAKDATFNHTTGEPIDVITSTANIYNVPLNMQPVTANPSTSGPPGFTNAQDLCVSSPNSLRAGIVWDLAALTVAPFALNLVTNITFVMRASQSVPAPWLYSGDVVTSFTWSLVTVNTSTFNPSDVDAFKDWPTATPFVATTTSGFDLQGNWYKDITSYAIPKIQSGEITSSMGLAVASNGGVTWIGSKLNNVNRTMQTLLVTVNVSLDIPTDCPTLLDPCACILKPGCGWCSLSPTVGYCLSGAAAGLCRIGTYSTGPNVTVPAELYRYLTPCAPGTIGPYGLYAEGLMNAMCACSKCLAGTYGTGTMCYPCPAGSYSQDGAAECTLCAPGTYQPAAGTNGCLDCPSPGVDCSQSGLTYPGQLLPGFSGCCLAKIDVRPCAEPTACPGGPCNCTVGFCTPGYVGDYCENCETAPQPYHRVSPGICVPCPNLAPLLIVVAAVFIFLLCLFLLRYGRTVAQYLTSLSIGLAFTQAVGLLKIFNFKLPPEMSVYIDIISVTNLSPDLFSAECAIPGMSYYTSFAVRILMPVGVGFVFMMIYLSVVIHSKIVQRCAPGFRVDHKELVRPRDNSLKGCAKMKESCRWQFVRFTTMTKTPLEISNFKGRVINAFITFLVLTYLYTSQTALSVFACEPNSAGTAYRIIGDGAVLCSGPQYTALKTAAYIALAVYTAGLPILFLGILLANRAQAQLADEKFLSRYGMLFSRYKPGRFYWELIIMMRKLLIVVCAVFSRVVRPTYATALIVVFGFLLTIVAQVVGRPFKYGQHNFLEGALLILYTLTVIAGASSVEGNIYVGSYAMLIFCNIGVLLMLITLIYDLVRRCRRVVNKSDRVTNVLSCCGGVFGDQDNMSTRTDGSEMSQFDSSRTRTNFESGRTNDFDSAKFPSGKSNFNSGRSNLPAPPPPAAAAAAPAAATAPPVTADEPNPAYEAPPSYATSNAQTNAQTNASANAASGRNYRSGKTPGGAPNPFLPSPAGTPNRNNPFLDVPEAGSDPTDQFASGKNRFLPKTPGGTPPAGSPAPAAAWNTAPPASTAVDWNRPHEARESAMPGADLTASGRQWNQAPPPSVAPGRVSATAAAPPMPDRPSRTATPSAAARGSNSPAPAMPPRPKG